MPESNATEGAWVVPWPFRYAYPLFLAAFGVAFLLTTFAEYFFPPAALLQFMLALLLIPVLLTGAIIFMWQVVLLALRLFKPSFINGAKTTVRIWSVAGFMVLVGYLPGTAIVSGWLTKRVEDRGDELVPLIQAYKDERGKCPESLSQLGAAAASPRLESSYTRFDISQSNDGSCFLYFEHGMFGFCGRGIGPDGPWYCD